MYRCLTALLLLVTTAAAAAPAWTWVDADGRRHFSDRPVPGATQINLPDGTTRGPAITTVRSADAQQSRSQPAAGAADQQSQASGYTRFDVLSPSNEQTLWNIGGSLNMQVAIEPALQPNHVLDVFLDGQRIELRQSGAALTVPDVFRGQHTLQPVIMDSRTGREVLRSQTVTITVQQTSLLNPNNPNR